MNADEDRIFIRVYLWPVLVNHFITVPVRFQHDLDAVVVLVLEDVVSVRCIVKTHRMCDDERWVNVAVLDQLQQRSHVSLHVRLAGSDRE